MPTTRFAGRVLVLGAGSVSQCAVPLLVEHLVDRPDRITIMDFVDNRDRFKAVLAQGVGYVNGRVTPENLPTILAEHLSRGDLLLDLAWNIETPTILSWCHDAGVLYMNTSVEVWDPYEDAGSLTPQERTLYVRHMALRRLRDTWQDPGPTAVVDHGANPGLVSHFVKRALVDIGERAVADGIASPAVREALAADRSPDLAEALGVKVIHIAERDTQIADRPKRVNEFVNTWSISGFLEEGVAPAELGWGTHETTLPAGAYLHDEGPRNPPQHPRRAAARTRPERDHAPGRGRRARGLHVDRRQPRPRDQRPR